MDEEYKLLIEKYLIDKAIPITKSKEEEENAIKECNEYLEKRNKKVSELNPLSVYYIIINLKNSNRTDFIKENIDYIKQNHEDIFLYRMESPKSLLYFLTFKDLIEINNIDKDLFLKILNSNQNYLFRGFTSNEYIKFFYKFYNDIDNLDNNVFLNLITSIDCGNIDYNMKDIVNHFDVASKENKEIINYILRKYEKKIETFNSNQLFKFITSIKDENIFKKILNENNLKIKEGINNINEILLEEILEELSPNIRNVLVTTYINELKEFNNFNKILQLIEKDAILKLYIDNREIFRNITLNDWIKISSESFCEEYKKILDTFKIDNIEDLYDNNFYLSYWHRNNTESLKYIESKYRDEIKIDGNIVVKNDMTIYSNIYLKNLKELNEKLKNKELSKNSIEYKTMLSIFIKQLKDNNIIFDIEGNTIKEIDKFFYKIVKGDSLTRIYELLTIKDIALYNRLGVLDFKPNDFTIEQIEKFNVKELKYLLELTKYDSWYKKDYKTLLLKLLLIVGFNNSKRVLEIVNDYSSLEHLLNIDVGSIKLDEKGNPTLNKKIINLLFSNNKIQDLNDKKSDLYKYFPRIFNEWEIIKMNNKDKTLKEIIEFLKSDEITVPPEYHRLVGLFKYIGCNNSVVKETLMLHDKILEREESSIPTIKGTKDEYTYEILDIHNMEVLTPGNRTECCFTVLGNGYSSLKHALLNKDGRILVIKKDNEIVAHSWLWRNGNLLCLDNIEISKSINEVNFLDVYLKLFDEILNISKERELNPIENITIGYTNFDKKIQNIDNFPCLILNNCDLTKNDLKARLGNKKIFVNSLPHPRDYDGYTDSKNIQYLIRGNGNFKLYDVDYNYLNKNKEYIKN